MNTLWNLAGSLVQGYWRKASAWKRSVRWTAVRSRLHFPGDTAAEIPAAWTAPANNRHVHFPGGSISQQELADRIRKETEAWNRNNVTRTQAYWNMYASHPELHWTLLAHMVSRNGGWCMTDLKGEWLPRLLSPEQAEQHYDLLETCNALIFRDAYPQLRLYAESRRLKTPLFALLPRLGVSSFMPPFWERFWKDGEPAPLTVALIVNEQNVIQDPVVNNPYLRERVLESPAFRSLRLLQTNQVVFPLSAERTRPLRPLTGRVIETFASLEERIGFGKCLYGMLFGYPRIRTGVEAFASKVPHTGSRADYWPEKFDAKRKKTGGKLPLEGLSAGEGWYSPTLAKAWPDRPLAASPAKDWFSDPAAVLPFISPPKLPRIVDITWEHLLCLRKWQTAAALAPERDV